MKEFIKLTVKHLWPDKPHSIAKDLQSLVGRYNHKKWFYQSRHTKIRLFIINVRSSLKMTIHGMCLYINTTIIVLRRVKIDNQDHSSKPIIPNPPRDSLKHSSNSFHQPSTGLYHGGLWLRNIYALELKETWIFDARPGIWR